MNQSFLVQPNVFVSPPGPFLRDDNRGQVLALELSAVMNRKTQTLTQQKVLYALKYFFKKKSAPFFR